jgi:hypothetical protein
VLWGFLNLVVGFALLFEFAPKGADVVLEWACIGLGVLLMALFLARRFGRVRSRQGQWLCFSAAIVTAGLVSAIHGKQQSIV